MPASSKTGTAYSAISTWETVAGLCRAFEFAAEQAWDRLRLFVRELGFRVVSIGEIEFAIAIDAYAGFGTVDAPRN